MHGLISREIQLITDPHLSILNHLHIHSPTIHVLQLILHHIETLTQLLTHPHDENRSRALINTYKITKL